MTEITTSYAPRRVSPPGGTLQDLLDERGMAQNELAERTGLTTKAINEVVKGKAALTPETALKLERALGVPADFWLSLGVMGAGMLAVNGYLLQLAGHEYPERQPAVADIQREQIDVHQRIHQFRSMSWKILSCSDISESSECCSSSRGTPLATCSASMHQTWRISDQYRRS